MFDQLHIIGDRAFEIRTEAHTVSVVRSYSMTDEGAELDPTELEFPTRELAETYVQIMINRLKGEDNDD